MPRDQVAALSRQLSNVKRVVYLECCFFLCGAGSPTIFFVRDRSHTANWDWKMNGLKCSYNKNAILFSSSSVFLRQLTWKKTAWMNVAVCVYVWRETIPHLVLLFFSVRYWFMASILQLFIANDRNHDQLGQLWGTTAEIELLAINNASSDQVSRDYDTVRNLKM